MFNHQLSKLTKRQLVNTNIAKSNVIPHAYQPEDWKARTIPLAINGLHSTILGSALRARIFRLTRLLICRVRLWNAGIEIARIVEKSQFGKV